MYSPVIIHQQIMIPRLYTSIKTNTDKTSRQGDNKPPNTMFTQMEPAIHWRKM